MLLNLVLAVTTGNGQEREVITIETATVPAAAPKHVAAVIPLATPVAVQATPQPAPRANDGQPLSQAILERQQLAADLAATNADDGSSPVNGGLGQISQRGVDGFWAILYEVFGQYAATFYYIADCETGGKLSAGQDPQTVNANAANWTYGYYSMWQIWSAHGFDTALLLSDIRYAAHAAWELSRHGVNLNPWPSC